MSGPIPDPTETHGSAPRSALLSLRVLLPAALVVVGVVLLVVGAWALAVAFVLAAGFILVADWMIRLAITSQDDREGEQRARRRFRRTGRWPGDR
jgi:hypothetical protein